MKPLRWILQFVFLISVFITPLTAAKIEADSADSPLIISGWVNEENSFTGNLRLTARGSGAVDFVFLPYDLKDESGEHIIPRQNVKLGGDLTLQPGIPKDFQVSVSGIKVAGTYRGQLEILLPAEHPPFKLRIETLVIARARPAVALLPGAEQVRLNLVNCRGWMDCRLVSLILPASASLNTWQLQISNDSPADAKILDLKIVIRGEKTGYQIPDSALALPAMPQSLPANKITSLPLRIKRSAIPPDHYSGTIYLKLEGREDRLSIPVDLNVRTGPFWPLAVLLLGILFGRLLKYMQDRGKPQSDALAAVNEVQALLNRADPGDRKILQPMVDAIRQLVYREKLETVQSRLEAVKARLEALEKLGSMQKTIEAVEQNALTTEIIKNIGKTRQLISEGKDSEVHTMMEEMEKSINKLDSERDKLMGETGAESAEFKMMLTQSREAKAAAEKAAEGPPSPITVSGWFPKFLNKMKTMVEAISGLSDEIRAEATFWLIRPLLWLVLLCGLLVVGISSLYVDNGLTFGANPLMDYTGLIIWGLSADVASRTLGNLRAGG